MSLGKPLMTTVYLQPKAFAHATEELYPHALEPVNQNLRFLQLRGGLDGTAPTAGHNGTPDVCAVRR